MLLRPRRHVVRRARWQQPRRCWTQQVVWSAKTSSSGSALRCHGVLSRGRAELVACVPFTGRLQFARRQIREHALPHGGPQLGLAFHGLVGAVAVQKKRSQAHRRVQTHKFHRVLLREAGHAQGKARLPGVDGPAEQGSCCRAEDMGCNPETFGNDGRTEGAFVSGCDENKQPRLPRCFWWIHFFVGLDSLRHERVTSVKEVREP